MLDEQGVRLQCSGYPTSLYFEQKISHKNGPMGIHELGPKSPFWAILTVIRASGSVSGSNHQNGGYWACWDPIGIVWDPFGTKKEHFGPKRAQLFSFFFKCLNPSVGPSLISSAVLYQHLKIWKIHFSQFEGFCPRAQLSGA